MKTFVCLIGLVCIYSVNAVFNCNRPGLSCNSGTCGADGTCSACPTGYEGYDCSVFTAGKTDAGCTTNPCQNSGTCYMPSGGTTTACLCTDKWKGATCTEAIYSLTCNAANMDIAISPAGSPFAGTLTVEGQTTAPCQKTASPYTFTALAFTDCGGTTTTGVSLQTIIVRFTPGVTTTMDERVEFRCGSNNNMVSQTATAVAVTALTNGDLGQVSEGAVPIDTDVDFNLLDGAAAPSGALTLGTVLTIKADLSTAAAATGTFSAVRIESCKAESIADNTDATYAVKNLVTAGCFDEMKSELGPWTITGTEKSFGLKLFKFTATTQVIITCDIKVCVTAADCAPMTCGDGSTGQGRKKRQAEDTGAVHKSLTRQVEVVDPLAVAAKTLQEFKESKACYQSWEMTATVVALAVALVIVLLICIFLVTRAILSRRSDNCREDVSETASTARFPHLPTLVSNKA